VKIVSFILPHWTPNDVRLSFGAFRKPSACKKMQNFCFGPKCTILVYRSCRNGFAPNASILLHWTPNDVWLSLVAFRKPAACKKMQNLCFGPKCTILVYLICGNGFAPNACILLHWTRNDAWLCFGALRKPSACKKMQNLCSGLNALTTRKILTSDAKKGRFSS
jgi:hypothetical protein